MQIAALALGGVIAVGIGYAIAVKSQTPTARLAAENAALRAEIAVTMSDIESRLAAVEATEPPAQIPDLRPEIDALSARVATQSRALQDRLDAAETSLAATLADLRSSRAAIAASLANTGGEISEATAALIAGYGAEIKALEQKVQTQISTSNELSARLDALSEHTGAQLEAARGKVLELSETAAASARNLDMGLAAERLRSALETGRAYGELLAQIAAEAAAEIPAVLLDRAEAGVVPLAELQRRFPSAARRAIKVSARAKPDDGIGARLTAFFKSQIGARSLEEKEGDDPDAILSRAEAALGRGELKPAVDLVNSLPKASLAEMRDWLQDAETRLAATSALEKFTRQIGAGITP